MEIRKIAQNEINFLEEMLYDAIYVPEGHPALERSIIYVPEIHKYIKNWGRANDCALVVAEQNELIGAIWGRIYIPPELGYGTIDEYTPEISMAIKKEFRNQGIGTKLLEAIFEEYLKLGFSALSLSVDKQNRAINLYKRAGFEILAENGDAWTMKKDLCLVNV